MSRPYNTGGPTDPIVILSDDEDFKPQSPVKDSKRRMTPKEVTPKRLRRCAGVMDIEPSSKPPLGYAGNLPPGYTGKRLKQFLSSYTLMFMYAFVFI